MIGRMRTTHPTEDYPVYVDYVRSGTHVRITAILNGDGKDIWGLFSSVHIQEFKRQILM